ncbi:unnamed protein product [Spirodela intermedia]|uniref:Uncharacterized protein n=1 Tax=Spirodela intermedia TaxID=51605 RepID=A0A7I8ISV4_SPIIN|nr:unnamed protein product [Spirodela intermedia]CAA6660860.1 unnamed protein product [Spirodela intermedia]
MDRPWGLVFIWVLSPLWISLFSGSHLVLGKAELTWTRRAAAEAEAVAAISCSGHGMAFVDGVRENGRPVCECNNCYSGPDCSSSGLIVLLTLLGFGDPLFLQPYWRRHAEGSAVVISGWHRMSYDADGRPYMTLELERHIRLLHKLVGNAAAEGKQIVFGAGSTQLLNAALHALAPDNSSSPSSVVATVPYYPAYQTQTEYWRSKVFEWKGATAEWLNSTEASTKDFIEFVTSPNNPDGRWQAPALAGSSVIHDRAYYWPHYSAIKSPADDDLMLFTLSKITGHAGSRFGWALIKDVKVYNKILQYIDTDTLGISRETQLRALKVLKQTISQIKKREDMFRFGYSQMRIGGLNSTPSSPLPTAFPCRSSPQTYAWVKCERKADEDCSSAIRAGGIIPRAGTLYGADSRYVRLSLIRSQDDFDQLLTRMKALTAQ